MINFFEKKNSTRKIIFCSIKKNCTLLYGFIDFDDVNVFFVTSQAQNIYLKNLTKLVSTSKKSYCYHPTKLF